MKHLFIILFISILAYSCSKETHCDNAQLCVKNVGNDTINYCWGCYPYTEVLLPGEKACRYVGEVTITSTEETYTVQYFDSDRGNIAIKMNDCYVEQPVD